MNIENLSIGMGKTEYNGLTIEVMNDPEPDNPREWDNLGVMFCSHGRYALGDKNAKDKLRKDIRGCSMYRAGWEKKYDFDNNADLAHLAEKCEFVVLPVYLYDHSGLAMNTSGFSCPFDSGQVGIIYATKEKLRNEYGVKRISKETRLKALNALRNEVATYDQYLGGNVWGWTVADEAGSLDGCWGYFEFESIEDDIKSRLPDLVSLT